MRTCFDERRLGAVYFYLGSSLATHPLHIILRSAGNSLKEALQMLCILRIPLHVLVNIQQVGWVGKVVQGSTTARADAKPGTKR